MGPEVPRGIVGLQRAAPELPCLCVTILLGMRHRHLLVTSADRRILKDRAPCPG